MYRNITLLLLSIFICGLSSAQDAETTPPVLSFETDAGTLTATLLGHASVRLELNDTVIHVDPWSNVADYSNQPDADWIWVTHQHRDHLDTAAIAEITKDGTQILMDATTAEASGLEGVTTIANGEMVDAGALNVHAVPSYNVVQERGPGIKYHPKGTYNGYVLEIGDFRMHFGGDTECVPEFGDLDNLTVSFLPINLPFTMTPEEAATCYKVMNPEIAIPYHQGGGDPQIVADMLQNSDIDVQIYALP